MVDEPNTAPLSLLLPTRMHLPYELQFSVVSRGALLCVCHSLVVIVPYVRLCTPTTTKSSVWYGIVPLDPGLASSSFYVPR